MLSSPRISFVMTSRNDDHGGGMTHRMRHCFCSLRDQANLLRWPVELLVVEWNPPPDRPPLGEVEGFPKSDDWFRFRIVTVAARLHHEFPSADKIPLFQYIAKNVGIRRASADLILCSNVDVILSDALARYLAHTPLADRRHYRVDRWDVQFSDVPTSLAYELRQELALERLVRVNLRTGSYSREMLGLPDEWPKCATPLASAATALAEIEAAAVEREPWQKDRPHTNACGDFALLSAAAWQQLRGYPEWPIHSWHIDSVFAAQGRAFGIAEAFLGCDLPIYHIHHDAGWAVCYTDGVSQALLDGPRSDGIGFGLAPTEDGYRVEVRTPPMPTLSYIDVLRFEASLRAYGPVRLNEDSWGMADRPLAETLM